MLASQKTLPLDFLKHTLSKQVRLSFSQATPHPATHFYFLPTRREMLASQKNAPLWLNLLLKNPSMDFLKHTLPKQVWLSLSQATPHPATHFYFLPTRREMLASQKNAPLWLQLLLKNPIQLRISCSCLLVGKCLRHFVPLGFFKPRSAEINSSLG